MTGRPFFLLKLFALFLSSASPAMAGSAPHWWEQGPPLPRLTGRVIDNAGLLSPTTEHRLAAQSAALEARTGHQFFILTVASLDGQSIENFGLRVGRTWKIGRARENDGVLLIVAPTEGKVRIEVGYGLEQALDDPACAKIIRNVILPKFGDARLSEGIEAGARAIIARISR